MVCGRVIAETGSILRALAGPVSDEINQRYFLVHLALRRLQSRGDLDGHDAPYMEAILVALTASKALASTRAAITIQGD